MTSYSDLLQPWKHDHNTRCDRALNRSLIDTVKPTPATMRRNNQEYLSFNDNDTLNLSTHPDVIQAAQQALSHEGLGVRASRLVSGNHPIYDSIETTLAQMKHSKQAILFGSGYLANIGVISTLAGKNDLIIADKRIHASLIDGITLSGATLKRYKHNNLEHCQQLMHLHRRTYDRCFIVTESVFSMDGTITPLTDLFDIALKHDAFLIADDAHGLATTPCPVIDHDHMIWLGTLSKATGCYGGYVCAHSVICNELINRARSLIYSTALPLPILSACQAALDIINSQPELCKIPTKNALYFSELMEISKAKTPIVPYIIGDNQSAVDLSHALEDRGILVPAIRPPTVPTGSARLRFTFCAAHTKQQIDTLTKELKILI